MFSLVILFLFSPVKLESPTVSSVKSSSIAVAPAAESLTIKQEPLKVEPDVEKKLLLVLCDIVLEIPSDAHVIAKQTSKLLGREINLQVIEQLLQKFEAQQMIR